MKLRIIYIHTEDLCTYVYSYASLVESMNKEQKAPKFSVLSEFLILDSQAIAVVEKKSGNFTILTTGNL